jgi:hypothetical protein
VVVREVALRASGALMRARGCIGMGCNFYGSLHGTLPQTGGAQAFDITRVF